METVPAWLAAIGLERYASTFESHGVDPRSLALLSEADLAEMGVLLGHRKLLLKAIEALSSPATASASHAVRDAERRQLTVLFCDLVGSTALSNRLDPEVLRDVMRDYQKTCSAVIERYAGHVAQYLGDGLVVYFGYPDAHEDDAERAVRAALEIVPAVQQITNGEALQVKVGIATGPVVVGKNEDGDPLLPNAAVGETPNIAARLQDVAGAGQIVIAPSTYRLLGDTFEIEDLGERVLKGIHQPVRARLIRGLGRSGSRFDATRAGRYTPLIGREQEVALLLSRWEQASEGEGQTVLLAGEPGIGKSRIVEELRERLAQAPQIRLQCSPLHAGSAFYPFIERLEREAGFERSDTPQRKLERLEAMLERTGEEVSTAAPLYAELLSLPTDRYPSRVVSPQRRHELTVAALAEQPFLLASKGPVLVICEDLHWIDPSSLETLSSMVERVHRAAILVVVTHRSEFASPWAAHGNVTSLNLNRLSRRHGAAMTRRLTGDKPLPDELLAKILDRTDGVPLFVEELTRDVLDGGLLYDAGDRYELRSPLPELAIPSTLKDSLTARLDRLGSAKESAQIGACIGREFGEGLLTATGLLPEGKLKPELERLVASGLVFRHGLGAETSYAFKHALIQDAAYESLLKRRRQHVHARIANALEKDFPEVVKGRPELLAMHLTRAESIDAALAQWVAAALLANSNTRYREALGHVEAGLAIVERAKIPNQADSKLALLVVAVNCHFVLTGFASQPVTALLERAEELLDSVSDQKCALMAMRAMIAHAYVLGDITKAATVANRCLALVDDLQDTDQRVAAYAAAALTLWQQGEFARARRLLEYVVENYDESRRLEYVRSNDAKVLAYDALAYLYMTTGFPEQARRCVRAGIDHATAIAHPFSLSMALSVGSRVLAELGDYEEAIEMGRQCVELCAAYRMPSYSGWAMVGEGAGLLGLGHDALAEARLANGLSQLDATGGWYSERGFIAALRAIALARLGRADEARSEVMAYREEAFQKGQRWLMPRLAHARGGIEMLDPRAPLDAAEHWLHTAISEARVNGDRMVEIRAATSLARLWQQQGKSREARELLAPLYEGFTEFNCVDLTEAKALLDTGLQA